MHSMSYSVYQYFFSLKDIALSPTVSKGGQHPAKSLSSIFNQIF